MKYCYTLDAAFIALALNIRKGSRVKKEGVFDEILTFVSLLNEVDSQLL